MPMDRIRKLRRRVGTAGNALLVLAPLAWMIDLPRWLGGGIHLEQLILLVIGLALLHLAAGDREPADAGGRPGVRFALMVAGALAAFWLSYRFATLSEEYFYHRPESFACGVIMCTALLAAVRERMGWPLVMLVLLLVVHALFGHVLPEPFTARSSTPLDLFSYLAVDGNAVIGTPMRIVVTMVAGYLLFGAFLRVVGGGEFFADLAALFVGDSRGATAKVSVFSSGLFGSLSGSAVANVVSTGLVTIPLMKRRGHSAESAAAIESSASTGGQLLPPVMGAAAFIMADFLQISYIQVAMAAAVPALLYYLALLMRIHVRSPEAPAEDANARPGARHVLVNGWPFLLLPATLLGTLVVFPYAPERAALLGIALVIVIGARGSYGTARPQPSDYLRAISDTGSRIADLVLVCAAAGIVIGIVSKTGLAFGLVHQFAGGPDTSLVVLLLITAAASIVLGMGMPTSAVYILLATMLSPALISKGVEPIAAHLFVLFFGVASMLTPPVAIAAYAAASVAGADKQRTAFTALAYAWPAFFIPFLFVYSPAILMQGSAYQIVATIVCLVTGVALMSVALGRTHCLGRSRIARTLLLVVGALLAILPIVPLEMRLSVPVIVMLYLAARRTRASGSGYQAQCHILEVRSTDLPRTGGGQPVDEADKAR